VSDEASNVRGSEGLGVPVRCEIIAVGSELLTPTRLDTNSLYLTERLNDIGIDVRAKAVVGDETSDLSAVLKSALGRADLIVLTGGLGPTSDDLTRETVSGVLGRPLAEDARIVAALERRFAARGLRMPSINRKQALVPAGARVLENPNGTAPGLWIDHAGQVVLLLPGPPRELRPIVETFVLPALAARTGGARLHRRVLRIALRPESLVEEATQPVYSAWTRESPPIITTILAAPGQVELHLSVVTDDERLGPARLDAAAAELERALDGDVFSTDGRSLEEVVGELLRECGATIALAESCTGGLVTSRLTDVPGSSDYVERAVVAYSNRSKVETLGVSASLIVAHGAVSEPVAAAMAEGVRARAGTTVGVGITGIAGPSGGSTEKPVGTVAIAVSHGNDTIVRSFRFPGSRDMVKSQAAQAALDLVRRRLLADREASLPRG
jgi:nicotinamide-nucleotide amidase